MLKKILIVEDDLGIRELLRLYLSKHGYQVVMAQDGIRALEIYELEQPDLILLDILLPGVDGYSVCQELRKYSNVPIIFISCKKDSKDIIEGLELGADDFITKPFDPDVLMARVQASLRRAPIFRRIASSRKIVNRQVIKYGNLEIDMANFEVRLDGNLVTLSAKELQLLIFLVQHPNQIFSTEQLYLKVWGLDSIGDNRTVMVHISNIRKKIESNPSQPERILNIRGIGYKFIG
ncbi:two component transcriptional regulator, winged helix family [Desulforamulus reducens MI-1]|uniref:Stage 0 sporulation protein A homolog n=1 Tax=Desulforamulus reducens (strain ATCC BAA-1160 / DSM 100696 / MI-1) TaxID=349161 RepID=A4J5L7_DESRM|nr:response regulator transcription factor [Desulforamulus reducens]ABO50370.1 two component transcriptional regulator, winged helix family [Desulforamulus reducens MI-1]